MNNIIEMKNVSKSFDGHEVLKKLDFNVPEGTIMGLIGRNGAGKSTMIKCMLGLLRPDKGISKISGEESWELSPDLKHRIGYVPQVMTGFKWMRVNDYLEYTSAFYKKWNEKKADALVKEWNLDGWAKIGNLSEGERQKLSIIQAMGHEPDIYIFDEPVASLDPAARRDFIKKLIEINISDNKTVLFSTHITSDLERVAAEIAILNNGVIQYCGDLAGLKERVCRLHISSQVELPKELPFNDIQYSDINGQNAVLTVNNFDIELKKIYEQELNASITIENLNLEEIFLEMTK